MIAAQTTFYMRTFTITDLKLAILKCLSGTTSAQVGNKFNLLGRPYQSGGLEGQLGVTFDPKQRGATLTYCRQADCCDQWGLFRLEKGSRQFRLSNDTCQRAASERIVKRHGNRDRSCL